MMKVLFTCGGTAGHINPAVALAGMFQKRNGAQILFVGADGGMENRLVPREGYEIRTVTITSFYRSLSAQPMDEWTVYRLTEAQPGHTAQSEPLQGAGQADLG